MIPDPIYDERGDCAVLSYHIRAALNQGIVGGCCLCGYSCVWWWDLATCGMPPVTDRRGALADEVALHPDCVPGVLGYWAMLIHGGDGDGEPVEVGSVPVASPPAAPTQAPPRTGAYARRRTRP